MKCRAKGLLYHHFWGEYYATIVLEFESEEQARAAMRALPGFELAKPRPRPFEARPPAVYLRWHGGNDALKPVEDQLVAFGADRRKITSLRYSVDCGEQFELDFAVDYDPAQMELPICQS